MAKRKKGAGGVVALAEKLGRIAGTVHAKAEGWVARKGSKRKPAAAVAHGRIRKRSGGVVDAPGKKHRKPAPAHPDANIADSQSAKLRKAKLLKPSRHRARG